MATALFRRAQLALSSAVGPDATRAQIELVDAEKMSCLEDLLAALGQEVSC